MRLPFPRLHYWVQNVLYTSLFIFALGLLFLILAPFHRVYDLSPEGRFSFNTKTKEVLKPFKNEPVQLIGFFTADDPVVQEIEASLPGLRRYLPQINFRTYDLERNPIEAKRYGVHEHGLLLVEAGGKRTAVMRLGEVGIREAFEKLGRKPPFVLFLKGHGETELASSEATGSSFLNDRLFNEACLVKQDFIESAYFDQADVLVVAYPKRDFTQGELERLSQFLEHKSALFMIDPEEKETYLNLAAFLSRYGASLGQNVIVDRGSRFFGADDLIPVATDFTHHEIVKNFEAPLFFPLARQVKMNQGSKDWEGDYLLFSGKESWGETDFGSLEQGNYAYETAKDEKGPLALGLAIERKHAPKNRILIFGDSDFINNTNYIAGGNRFLFLNSISWLLKDKLRYGSQRLAPGVEVWVLPDKLRGRLFWFTVPLPAVLSLIALGGMFLIRRCRS